MLQPRPKRLRLLSIEASLSASLTLAIDRAMLARKRFDAEIVTMESLHADMQANDRDRQELDEELRKLRSTGDYSIKESPCLRGRN